MAGESKTKSSTRKTKTTKTTKTRTRAAPAAPKAPAHPVPDFPHWPTLKDHVTVGTWRGLPNYECIHCPAATPTIGRAWQHLVEFHLSKPSPTRAVNTGLVTESGEPIVRDVPAEEE